MNDLDKLIDDTKRRLDEAGVADRTIGGSYRTPAGTSLAGYFDHTVLKPETSAEMVENLCNEAMDAGTASVCVPPNRVEQAASLLTGTTVKVCTVTGFPLGYDRSEAKVAETKRAVALGAHEIDMVLSIGLLKDGDLRSVYNDIRVVVEAAAPAVVKLIVETALLTKEELVIAGLLGVHAGCAFLKTSTGFGPAGAKTEHVEALRRLAGDKVGVKAAGGIKTLAFVKELVQAGADRIGASSTLAILAEAEGQKGE